MLSAILKFFRTKIVILISIIVTLPSQSLFIQLMHTT